MMKISPGCSLSRFVCSANLAEGGCRSRRCRVFAHHPSELSEKGEGGVSAARGNSWSRWRRHRLAS